jgi:hypothetical protein
MNVDFHASEEKGTPRSFNGENNEKWEEIKKAEFRDLVCGLTAGWMGETEAADHARDKPVDIDAAARGKAQVSLDSESTEVEACAKNAAKEAFESDKDYAEAMVNQGREAADVADLHPDDFVTKLRIPPAPIHRRVENGLGRLKIDAGNIHLESHCSPVAPQEWIFHGKNQTQWKNLLSLSTRYYFIGENIAARFSCLMAYREAAPGRPCPVFDHRCMGPIP